MLEGGTWTAKDGPCFSGDLRAGDQILAWARDGTLPHLLHSFLTDYDSTIWQQDIDTEDDSEAGLSEELLTALSHHSSAAATTSSLCCFYNTRCAPICTTSAEEKALSDEQREWIASFYNRAGQEVLASGMILPGSRFLSCDRARVGGLEVKTGDFVLSVSPSVLPASCPTRDTPLLSEAEIGFSLSALAFFCFLLVLFLSSPSLSIY